MSITVLDNALTKVYKTSEQQRARARDYYYRVKKAEHPNPRGGVRKYATEEERREAKRRQNRESAARMKALRSLNAVV